MMTSSSLYILSKLRNFFVFLREDWDCISIWIIKPVCSHFKNSSTFWSIIEKKIERFWSRIGSSKRSKISKSKALEKEEMEVRSEAPIVISM